MTTDVKSRPRHFKRSLVRVSRISILLAILLNPSTYGKNEKTPSTSESVYWFERFVLSRMKEKDAAAMKEKDALHLKMINALENYGIQCAFVFGRLTCENCFEQVSKWEDGMNKLEKFKRFTQITNEIRSMKSNSKLSKKYKVPEDTRSYDEANHDILENSTINYFSHWKPFLDKCDSRFCKRLSSVLDNRGLSKDEFGWSMCKFWAVFNYYLKLFSSVKFRNSYLQLIKHHNEWIITKKDLLYLNIAARVTGSKGIHKFSWYDEEKKLAIPIARDNEQLDEDCVAVLATQSPHTPTFFYIAGVPTRWFRPKAGIQKNRRLNNR